MPDGRADAVGPRVAAPDYHDIPALGRDEFSVGVVRIEEAFRIGGQVFHREMDSGELAPLDRQIPRPRRAAGEHDGVAFGLQFSGGDARTLRVARGGADAGHEAHSLGGHEVYPPGDDSLVELHVRDAIHEYSADPIRALVDGHFVSRLIELVGAGEAGGAGAYYRHLLARPPGGRLGNEPAFFPASVDDAHLVVLYRYGRERNRSNGAGAFAGGRADAAGELGEVVREPESPQGLLPEATVEQVVPFRDEIVDGAARHGAVVDDAAVAERRAAIHAAGGLVAIFLLGLEGRVEFVPVLRPLRRGPVGGKRALVFDKTGRFGHGLYLTIKESMNITTETRRKEEITEKK